MLSWPAGPRSTDGAWAPVWYEAVERSTGFAPPPAEAAPLLSGDLARIAEEARPLYENLARYRLSPFGLTAKPAELKDPPAVLRVSGRIVSEFIS